MKKYRLIGILAFLSLCLTASAQRFFNLTYDETSVDSVLPNFTYSIPLTEGYRDSVYTSSILYPEFVDMCSITESFRQIRCLFCLISRNALCWIVATACLMYSFVRLSIETENIKFWSVLCCVLMQRL